MFERCCHTRRVSCWIAGAVFCLAVVSMAQVHANVADQPTVVPLVETEELVDMTALGVGTRARWESRFPLDLESYVPMPVPRGKGSVSGVKGTNRQVTYNLRTKQQTFRSPESRRSAQSGRMRGRDVLPSMGGRDGLGLLNFSDMTRDFNAVDYPWSVNCKLFMTFVDETETYLIRAWGSGILVDSEHVLTAAHCLYSHDIQIGETVYAINAWASEVIVVPAYEDEIRPFGDAAAVALDASEGWTVHQDYNHDIGIVQLDRPVGAIADWLLQESEDDPAFYTENVFDNSGYPQAWPYDGEYMYLWSGSFDQTDYDPVLGEWLGNTVSIDRLAYGGQSGSGACMRTLSGRMVYAVLSHGLSGRTHFTRVTREVRDEIDDFIVGNAPLDADLVPLYTQAEATKIDRGKTINDMSFILHNNSYTWWIGRCLIAAFMSDDRIISTADTHLGQFYGDLILPPKSSITATMPPIQVPPDTNKGRRYLGIYLLSDDSDGTNDMSSVQDVAPIIIGFNVLEDDVPQTIFRGPINYAFDVVGTDWCCVGISPTVNYDLWVYDNANLVGSHARSTRTDDSRDFVVVNGHEWGDSTHYAKVGQMLGGSYGVEATWHVADLVVGVEHSDVMDADEVHEIYEIYLVADTPYQLNLDVTSGAGDLSIYVFEPTQKSGSASDYGWKADERGSRGDEQLSFTATSTGYHAIAVINENAKSAEYSLVVQP